MYDANEAFMIQSVFMCWTKAFFLFQFGSNIGTLHMSLKLWSTTAVKGRKRPQSTETAEVD